MVVVEPFVPGLPRYGQAWTLQECQHLRSGFSEGLSLIQLTQIHGRTRAAITSKLVEMHLLTVIGRAYYPVHREPWATFLDVSPRQREKP